MNVLPMEYDYTDFINYYDKFKAIVYNILGKLPLNNETRKQIIEYYLNCIEYNVKKGKHIRGRILVLVSSLISTYSNMKMNSIYLLGWIVETIQALILIADDIMDSGKFRRGAPCWHIVHGQSNGVNDIFFLKMLSLSLISELSSVFGDDVVLKIQRIYNESIFYTVLGQHLDLSNFDLSKIDEISERYFSMVEMKTSRYTFYMPVLIGLTVSEIQVPSTQLNLIKTILYKLGELYQVHNDITDYLFNDDSVDDIYMFKLTWPLQKSFELANEEIRLKISENYGKNSSIVKDCYNLLNINVHYLEYQKNTLDYLIKLGKDITDDGLRKIFIILIHQVLELITNSHLKTDSNKSL
ncbi:farnesyl pyrophosphate synthase [Cryptosporidium sp. chipmunk genotype I]|uniref:farnesyl pyrophosphate synthase n=1 Tax=Cryptosporidium sp. chipmunk genotype I TaxID=1280935 RepID=UPI00351A1142|nr:farnesyl pyrophosphate synthase [Cryptosporidium sp. chipmunk genotype I]